MRRVITFLTLLTVVLSAVLVAGNALAMDSDNYRLDWYFSIDATRSKIYCG